jgi:RHS repeat-associated protein
MTKYGTTAMEWDHWGNMINVGTQYYYYDDAARLTKYDAVYQYLPGSHQRYKRTQDTTAEYYVSDGPNVLDSYAANGSLNARYVTPGLDANLAMTRSGNTYYYMADGLGSVRNVVNSSEVVQNTYDFYAFGNTLGTPTVGVTNPFEYTGREFEDGSVNTTFYYRNRYYMSGLGIFTSRDVMGADIQRGWGYVRNRPTLFVDPLGRSIFVRGQGMAGANGGVAVSTGPAFDWSGVYWVTTVAGGGVIPAGASVTGSVGYFPGPVANMGGMSSEFGGSGSYGMLTAGGNLLYNSKGKGFSLDAGFAVPWQVPVEGHALVGNTWVDPLFTWCDAYCAAKAAGEAAEEAAMTINGDQ